MTPPQPVIPDPSDNAHTVCRRLIRVERYLSRQVKAAHSLCSEVLLANCYQKNAPAQHVPHAEPRLTTATHPGGAAMAEVHGSTIPATPQLSTPPCPRRLPPMLTGEILAWNFMAANRSRERITRIAAKLGALLAAADAIKAKEAVQ